MGPGRSRFLIGACVAAVALVAAACKPDEWTMFGHDVTHSGRTHDSDLIASNAASLDVAWKVDTGDAVYASPVVGETSAGRVLVVTGNQLGTVVAYDAATGARVWTFQAGAAISTPTIANGIVYAGSADHKLYALDATNGALRCAATTNGLVLTPPLVVDPDGNGATVYFGDVGGGGGDDGGHLWAISAVDPNNAADCSTRWTYGSFGEPEGSQPLAGVWAPPAYALDKNGRPLVVVGSSSPDDAVYAFDARTGARVWRFQTRVGSDTDVGAGATIGAPGVNGLADGAVYVANKDNVFYALNLRTGTKLWQFDIDADAPNSEGEARSTAALDGNRLFLGYGGGLYALDAVTGAKVWRSDAVGPKTGEVIAAPAESGTGSTGVLFAGDRAGMIRAFRASTGAALWSRATGNTIYTSAAIWNGVVFVGSADGFLYAFGRGGADPARPGTTIANPHDGALVPNPNGTFNVTGGATGTNIAAVKIALKDVNRRRWWNANSNSWSTRLVENNATLTNPNANATFWSWPFAIPFDGGRFKVEATAVDGSGRRDATAAVAAFSVESLGQPATATITSPSANQTIVFPGGVPQTFNLTISGNASDSGGATPGVAKVWAEVENIDHGEWFCGPVGCNHLSSFPWIGDEVSVNATLANPNATSTTWSFAIPTYDHPHAYQATVWAQDRDGHLQQLRNQVTFCVKTAAGPCP